MHRRLIECSSSRSHMCCPWILVVLRMASTRWTMMSRTQTLEIGERWFVVIAVFEGNTILSQAEFQRPWLCCASSTSLIVFVSRTTCFVGQRSLTVISLARGGPVDVGPRIGGQSPERRMHPELGSQNWWSSQVPRDSLQRAISASEMSALVMVASAASQSASSS